MRQLWAKKRQDGWDDSAVSELVFQNKAKAGHADFDDPPTLTTRPQQPITDLTFTLTASPKRDG